MKKISKIIMSVVVIALMAASVLAVVLYDTDGGNRPLVPGECVGHNETSSTIVTSADECYGANYLGEYFKKGSGPSAICVRTDINCESLGLSCLTDSSGIGYCG